MRRRTLFPEERTGSRLTVFLLVAAVLAPSLIQARFRPTSGFNLFSADQEVQAGQQAAAETNKQNPLLPDSNPVTQYVKRLGAKLVEKAPGTKWPYNFHVVAASDINAFALPGGPIYVNLGTIQAAENEAELAGVMSHEISHVVQRHSTRAATKQMEAQLPLSILGGFLGQGIAGQLANYGIQFGAQSYFLKNSRDNEKQADLLGTDIMYDNGYDPHYMARFFQIIQQKYPSRAPQFLSDHPDPGNRIQYVDAEVKTLEPKQYTNDSDEFQQVRRMALGMKAYSAQQIAQMAQQGLIHNGEVSGAADVATSPVAATPSYTQFQHNAYTISYPSDWKVYGDQSSAVTIAPAQGVIQNEIAYGAIISGFQPEDVTSVDAATHQLLAELKQNNPALRQIGNDEDIRVNGVAAKSVDLISASPLKNAQGKNEQERDWLVVLPLSDKQHVLYCVFVAPDSQYGSLRPQFEQMVRTLRLR